MEEEDGSSPRARGTRNVGRNDWHVWRFIPACAGNTRIASAYSATTAVHPRVRGEHVRHHHKSSLYSGSSPRARGTHHAPTCAATECGSSPRARGTHRLRGEGLQLLRFIPACAGNTSDWRSASSSRRVHPRVRGEHLSIAGRRATHTGSSPRARGTPAVARARQSRSRFIPACAGNTPRRCRSTCGSPVHPRVRGEHAFGDLPGRAAFGSSPRARGTPRDRNGGPERLRFIPACAGNTHLGEQR